jgi:hypothetical protein
MPIVTQAIIVVDQPAPSAQPPLPIAIVPASEPPREPTFRHPHER